MGFLDKIKKTAEDAAEEHSDKIDGTIDKVAEIADKKTGGKHSDKIETGAEKAKDFVEGLGGDDD